MALFIGPFRDYREDSNLARVLFDVETIFFLVLPSPQKGGGVGWGRAQQQQQKPAAAAAAAAAARQGQTK
jgi:hypothetical protein